MLHWNLLFQLVKGVRLFMFKPFCFEAVFSHLYKCLFVLSFLCISLSIEQVSLLLKQFIKYFIRSNDLKNYMYNHKNGSNTFEEGGNNCILKLYCTKKINLNFTFFYMFRMFKLTDFRMHQVLFSVQYDYCQKKIKKVSELFVVVLFRLLHICNQKNGV